MRSLRKGAPLHRQLLVVDDRHIVVRRAVAVRVDERVEYLEVRVMEAVERVNYVVA